MYLSMAEALVRYQGDDEFEVCETSRKDEYGVRRKQQANRPDWGTTQIATGRPMQTTEMVRLLDSLKFRQEQADQNSAPRNK